MLCGQWRQAIVIKTAKKYSTDNPIPVYFKFNIYRDSSRWGSIHNWTFSWEAMNEVVLFTDDKRYLPWLVSFKFRLYMIFFSLSPSQIPNLLRVNIFPISYGSRTSLNVTTNNSQVQF